ncbi:MAG: Hsp20/alpha crystallin family protein [Gammaproteobacteria bacterium]|nr:Hsp20/alpha crystallin family protein [Gammaproteobacteria bacterium]
MAITRYEPFTVLNQLQRELNRFREGDEGSSRIATAEWAPAVDIKEEDSRFVIHADIPGVNPEDIDVDMENGVLTIKGEKQSEAKTEKDNYKRVERIYGSFYRRFSLPETADNDAISAKAKNGVLEIVIPKREAVKPKKISVVTD